MSYNTRDIVFKLPLSTQTLLRRKERTRTKVCIASGPPKGSVRGNEHVIKLSGDDCILLFDFLYLLEIEFPR